MLKIKELDVYHGYVQAVRGLSLHVKEGELLAILGANGAGKSTLLGTLAGLYKPADGKILMKEKREAPSNKETEECAQLWQAITGNPPEKMVCRGISLVPERREIFSSLSVGDNLILGAFHRYRSDKATISEDMREVLEIFPALKGQEKELAGTLSGGLQQMLAIGRALMARPKLLLLDEPSIGLAPLIVREIMSILAQLKNTDVTIMLVEQNTRAALQVADRALVMERGIITMSGSADELMADTKVQQAYLGRTRVQPTAVAL